MYSPRVPVGPRRSEEVPGASVITNESWGAKFNLSMGEPYHFEPFTTTITYRSAVVYSILTAARSYLI